MLPAVILGLLTYWLLGGTNQAPHGFDLDRALQLFSWIGPSIVIYLVCLLSDRAKIELPATTRLLAFLIASLGFVGLVLSLLAPEMLRSIQTRMSTYEYFNPLVGVLAIAGFVAIGILAFTNFFNFMDGIDGLAGSMGVIGFATFGTIALLEPSEPSLGIATLIISASCCGFLIWNWPKAKVFMGDTGSTFLGFSAAALGWLGSLDGLWHWSFSFLVFFPFWFDASSTLLRRLFRGEKIWKAHREHFYQRAVLSLEGLEMSERHLRVLIPAIALMLVSSFVAIAQHLNWLGLSRFQPWAAVAVLTLIHASLALWVEARYKSSAHHGATHTSKK